MKFENFPQKFSEVIFDDVRTASGRLMCKFRNDVSGRRPDASFGHDFSQNLNFSKKCKKYGKLG